MLAPPEIEVREGGVLVHTGARVPALLVTCQVCGYFLTVNAISAGIRQLPDADEADSQADGT